MAQLHSEAEIARLAEALGGADRIVSLTGAGISAESGVPTFRGDEGLWRGRAGEELASSEAFERDPRTVWEFYDWRRTLVSRCAPNDGHRALRALADRSKRFTLVTQNVDGLHAAAGHRAVVELHGNLWRLRCQGGCGEREDRRAPMPEPLPPRCECGALLRPAVVWFGEMLPADELRRAVSAAETAEIMLVVGTSGLVEPAASLTRIARAAGALVVEINPIATALSAVAHDVVRATAAGALARIVSAVPGRA